VVLASFHLRIAIGTTTASFAPIAKDRWSAKVLSPTALISCAPIVPRND